MSFNPVNPTKYKGTDKYITFFVTRNRSPTGADYKQPETGRNYTIGTIWQVGKDPSDGVEGDEWILSKIVANVAYWVKFVSGVSPSGPILSLSDTADVLVYPRTDAPVGNIKLNSISGDLAIVSDPANHEIDFSIPSGRFFEGFLVDEAVPPGVNPVTPDSNGLATLFGDVIPQAGVPFRSITRALNSMGMELQISADNATSDATKNGICHFDADSFDVDANGFVTLLGDLDDLHWPLYIVGDLANGANYTTIAAAYAAAPAGQTIAIQPGTYVEDITITKNMFFNGLSPVGKTIMPNVIFNGKMTISGGFNIVCTNITFETNADVSFNISGSGAYAECNNCYLNGVDSNSVSGTGTNSNFVANSCVGVWASTFTLGVFTNTTLWMSECRFQGLGTLAATTTETTLYARNCVFVIPFSSSAGGALQFLACTFGALFTPYNNQTWIGCGGTEGGLVFHCQLFSGTASCITIGTGSTATVANNVLRTTNTNVLTGAGTVNTGGNVCIVSSGNNVSTINTLTSI